MFIDNMSCFFAPKPYALNAGEIEARAIADFAAILTCPIWLPIFGIAMGSMSLYQRYKKNMHRQLCSSISKKLLSHAQHVKIGDGYMYWKTKNVIYIVEVREFSNYISIPLSSIIQESWVKGTNFVITYVQYHTNITADFIRDIETTKIMQNDENDTIVVMTHNYSSIGNLQLFRLIDGYYGIISKKFNIVYPFLDDPSVSEKEQYVS
jgi:hypothetical protein